MKYVYTFLAGTAVGLYARGKLKKALPSKDGIVEDLVTRVTDALFSNKKKGGK